MTIGKIQQGLEVDFKVLILIQILCLIHKLSIINKVNKYWLIKVKKVKFKFLKMIKISKWLNNQFQILFKAFRNSFNQKRKG